MNKMLNKIKLKWRIFGFLLGFCILLLVVLWLFQTALLGDFYRRIRIAETRNDVATIVYYLNDAELPEIVSELSADGDFTADIVDLEGRSMISSGSRPNSQATAANLSLIASARENGGEFYRFTTSTPSTRTRSSNPERRSGSRDSRNRRSNNRSPVESLIYVRLADDKAVIVNAVVSPVFATTTTLRYQLYVISGIMFVLAAILAIIIAKRVSKPIEEISNSAMDLAKGQYDTRFSGKGFYEIVGLSETLNTTAVELGRTEKLRRELLANVSHDLRTPIALIYSYAEMMHDFPEDITKEQTEVIMEETKRLTGLINDVLDISKLEAGVEQLNITHFNLTKSLSETVERLQELLVKQDYKIDFSFDEDISIDADEVMLNRAFYNLLVNAVNFAGDDRKILVEMTTTPGIRVSVTDHGEGISEAELPFIWDRYYKSGKAHKRPVTGTGLGLSIVKMIIKLHGGTCGVTSEIGKGSTFWFELPQDCSQDFQTSGQ